MTGNLDRIQTRYLHNVAVNTPSRTEVNLHVLLGTKGLLHVYCICRHDLWNVLWI